MAHGLFTIKKRLEAARELYRTNKPWSRTLAWKILKEIALITPGNYSQYEIEIASAVEEEDMREAFRLLGAAAHQVIEDLEYAEKEKYNGRD